MENEYEGFLDLKQAYGIVRNNNDCTIVYANSAFYDLIHVSQKEVEFRYGMRFSALVSVDTIMQIKNFMLTEQMEMSLEMPLSTQQDEQIWVNAIVYKKGLDTSTFYIVFVDIQAYKQAEMERDFLHQEVQHFVELSNEQVMAFDTKTKEITQLFTKNDMFSKITLHAIFPDILLALQMVHADDISTFLICYRDVEQGKEEKSSVEIRIKDQEGRYIWMRMTLSNRFAKKGYVLCMFTDVHILKETMSSYMDQSLYYHAILTAQDAYVHCDITASKIITAGGLWASFAEYKDQYTCFELFQQFIVKNVHKDDRAQCLEIINPKHLQASYDNGIYVIRTDFRRYNDKNKMAWMTLALHIFMNPINKHLFSLMYVKHSNKLKISQPLQSEQRYDPLTKLYSKDTLKEKITSALLSMPESEKCAFVIMDIIALHKINEAYGYTVGDAVLVCFSKLLVEAFRQYDIIGRFGGGDFIILLKNIRDDKIEKRLDHLFGNIQNQTNPPFQVCAGVVYTQHGDTFMSCFKLANKALFQAKQNNTNGYEVISQDDEALESNPDFKAFMQKHHPSETNSLKQDESFYQLLNEESDIAYLIDPKTYELLMGNAVLYGRLGMSRDECRGKHCYELLHKRTRPCPFCQKMNWTYDEFFMYRNYNEVLEQEFLIKNKLVTWKGDTVLLACAVELSSEHQTMEYIDNDTMNNNYLLTGIQNMQKASSLDAVVLCALETTQSFFGGEVVRFWKYEEEEKRFYCLRTHAREKTMVHKETYQEYEQIIVNEWLHSCPWDDYKLIESKEAMMTISYEMYQMMSDHHIQNQRWCEIDDENGTLGVIEIDNLAMNFRNSNFMRAFKFYFINEWKRCKLMEDILYNASHDPLTGLWNRSSYDTFVLQYDEDHVSSATVIVFDIDGLSNINAMKGTATGDCYLQHLAKYLLEVFMENKVFRLSGDEFQVIMLNVEVEEVERKINELLCMLDELDLFTVSVGYAHENVDKKIKEMAQYAMQAMLIDKKQHQNRSQDMYDRDYYKMQNDLLACFQRNEFMIYLQPKVNTNTNYVMGAEALIRYHLKDGTIVPPSKYIPTLEKIGLIRYIDMFVFEEVCKIMHKWRKAGVECPVISLNFSRFTMMEQTLINGMETIITKYDVDRKHIEIEITESFVDVSKALLYQGAKRIHNAGFSVSLDDFGTDYTNLSILSDIHVDVLKLDKSLIHSLAIQRKNQVILKNIIQMCHDLAIDVIAEGVEDVHQKELLQTFGCHLIQGYYYSKPVEIATFEQQFLDRYIMK